jgi:pyridoxine 4-dehydrogenase
MERRRLGSGGPEVGALGLGCMGMSWAYGPADEGQSVATIQGGTRRWGHAAGYG